VASLHAAGNLVDELSSTVVLADLWLTAGRPGQARRLYEQALRKGEAHGGPTARATADLHVGLSELDVDVGELESARRHLETAAALGERAAMPEGRYRWYVASALLAQAEGRPEEAVKLLNQAEQLYRPGFFPDVRPIAALRARVWIAQGQLSEAGEWAREHGVAVTDDVSFLREFDHLTLVRLVIARHLDQPDGEALDQALGLLDRLLGAAEASGRGGSAVEIRTLWGLALDARTLRATASREAPGGALSERELEVVRLLGSELSGPEIARQLYVSANTLRTHTKHIYTKLEVSSRRAAVRRARERGLIKADVTPTVTSLGDAHSPHRSLP
jgi:LuxR family maltose regulon positive regulatory protein